MEEKYLVCEDSLEGIFTGIYEAYALREGHEHVHIQIFYRMLSRLLRWRGLCLRDWERVSIMDSAGRRLLVIRIKGRQFIRQWWMLCLPAAAGG